MTRKIVTSAAWFTFVLASSLTHPNFFAGFTKDSVSEIDPEHEHSHPEHHHEHGHHKGHRCVHGTKFKDLKLGYFDPYRPHLGSSEDLHERQEGEKSRQGDPDSGPGKDAGEPKRYIRDQKHRKNNPNRRILKKQETSNHRIRIHIDYADAKKLIAKHPEYHHMFQMSKRILTNVKKFFQTRLNVTFIKTYNFAKDGKCNGLKVKKFKKDVDLYILVKGENNADAPYFAAAAACILSIYDNRPIMGVYYLNFAKMNVSRTNEFLYFATFAHEFTHILGFSDNLYDKYKHRDGTPIPLNQVVKKITLNGRNYDAFVLPELVGFARKHFNCATLEAVPLENGGGPGSAGSHWEKSFFAQEYMNPTTESPAVISDFTFVLLNSTGWYTVDAESSQHYEWGKNGGCEHFEECPGGHEYCSTEQVGYSFCTPDNLNKGYCENLELFTGKCNIIRSFPESLCHIYYPGETKVGPTEEYGPHSRCFEWKKSDETTMFRYSECNLAKCVDGKVKIKLKSFNRTYTCLYDGQEIEVGANFILKCPVAGDFCTDWSYRCPMDCFGNGICLQKNKCFCFSSYSGADCGNCTYCPKIWDTFILSANYGSYLYPDKTEDQKINIFGATRLTVSLTLLLILVNLHEF